MTAAAVVAAAAAAMRMTVTVAGGRDAASVHLSTDEAVKAQPARRDCGWGHG